MKKLILITSIIFIVFLSSCKSEDSRYDSDYTCSPGAKTESTEVFDGILDKYEEGFSYAKADPYSFSDGDTITKSDIDSNLEVFNEYTEFSKQDLYVHIRRIILLYSEDVWFSECISYNDIANNTEYTFSVDGDYFSLEIINTLTTYITQRSIYELDIIKGKFNYRFSSIYSLNANEEVFQRKYIEFLEDKNYVNYFESSSLIMLNTYNKSKNQQIYFMSEGINNFGKVLTIIDKEEGRSIGYTGNDEGELVLTSFGIYNNNNFVVDYNKASIEARVRWNILYLNGWDQINYDPYDSEFLNNDNILDLGNSMFVPINDYEMYAYILSRSDSTVLTEEIFSGQETPFNFDYISFEDFALLMDEAEGKSDDYLNEFGLSLDYETMKENQDILFYRYINND